MVFLPFMACLIFVHEVWCIRQPGY